MWHCLGVTRLFWKHCDAWSVQLRCNGLSSQINPLLLFHIGFQTEVTDTYHRRSLLTEVDRSEDLSK